MTRFDYDAAVKSGYTDEEITNYLTESRPKFKVKEAINAGYDLKEITDHLNQKEPKEENKEERTGLQKGGRIAAQYGLGVAEGTPAGVAYDVAVAPLANKEAQTVQYRENLFSDIERLQEQKQAGVWGEKDQELYDSLVEQVKDTEKSEPFVKTADLSIRGLIEKIIGVDLHPEGVAEKAAQWAGFIKDPKKLFELGKTGLSSRELIKAISPSGREALQGLGAGAALEFAEQGGLGPIGTLAAAVVGDIGGRFVAGAAKTGAKILTNPKKALAEIGAKFTNKDKLDLQKEIIKDFREADIAADIGTLTDSDLVKWVQSRLAQSGLTGDDLTQLKDKVTKQIKEEYKSIADSVGESRFTTNHEAGQVAKDYMKKIRDEDLQQVRDQYKEVTKSLHKDAHVPSQRLAGKIKEIEESLKPGQIKSAEQNIVLENLEKIKRDIYDSEGNLLYGNVKSLMNDKIALNDIINYEVQGGMKQLLKGVVAEIDRAIISHGKENAAFEKNYVKANQKAAEHAKTFRNKRVTQLLSDADPAHMMNKMNTVQGIKDVEAILSRFPDGMKVLDNLKRFRLDRMIEDNFVDSVTQQLKLGTFSKLLDKGKNREVIKELLPKQAFNRLTKLQKNAGKLAESSQKFLNTSKTGITLEDASIVSKAMWDVGLLLTGNPWPLLHTAAGVSGARYLTKLMGDPEFLRLVEDMILATEKNNVKAMERIGKEMVPIIRLSQKKDKER
jgi:hypothetical protein